jgi:hypothetical protein
MSKRCKISELKLQEDRLWGTHYWNTREVIRDAVNSDQCLEVDLNSLYDNQIDIGTNFGELTKNKKAGRALSKALKIHIDIAVQIVLAAIKGESIENLYLKWQENASDIARVYHKYHHEIKYKKMNKMMQIHLETTLAEATAIIEKDCVKSYETGEIALNHIYMMSDYILSTF